MTWLYATRVQLHSVRVTRKLHQACAFSLHPAWTNSCSRLLRALHTTILTSYTYCRQRSHHNILKDPSCHVWSRTKPSLNIMQTKLYDFITSDNWLVITFFLQVLDFKPYALRILDAVAYDIEYVRMHPKCRSNLDKLQYLWATHRLRRVSLSLLSYIYLPPVGLIRLVLPFLW